MKNKAKTKHEAKKILAEKQKHTYNPESIDIYKFTGKRKYKYFIGNWGEWLTQIS